MIDFLRIEDANVSYWKIVSLITKTGTVVVHRNILPEDCLRASMRLQVKICTWDLGVGPAHDTAVTFSHLLSLPHYRCALFSPLPDKSVGKRIKNHIRIEGSPVI